MGSREVVLVTGANTGIGFEIVRGLCSSDKTYDILLAGRSLEKAQQASKSATEEFPASHSKVWPIQIDIEDDDSMQRAFEEVQSKFGQVDALINNAGTLFDFQLTQGHLTLRQTWTQSWTVNTVGPQILTSIFAPLLLKSRNPRLLFVTSGLSALSGTENLAIPFNRPPTTNGWPKVPIPGAPAYRSSKTGLNMMMREWHRLLRNDGVKVWCLSPGYLATGLGGDKEINKKMGAGDAAVAGPFVRSVVEGSRDGDVGKVVTVDGVQGW